ncbi:MAG: holo-ACP synthase [Dermatophilaceae bacterium]
MTVYGIGTDIVEVSRVAQLWARHGRTFAERWFAPSEIAYCETQTVPEQHLAVRLAAKEAVWKALDIPWDGGSVPWRSITVTRSPSGRPGIELEGLVAERAEALGCGTILLSMSHTRDHAVANALVLSR